MTDSNQFYHSNLYSILEDNISKAQQEVILVAPFIKNGLLKKLLQNIDTKVELTIITRWRIEEILSGVSDIEIWELLKTRNNSSLKLNTNLHAKYYRFDQTCVFGSANLTQKALIESSNSNLEILYRSNFHDDTGQFEELLLRKSIHVSSDYFTYVKRLVAELKPDYENLFPSFPEIDLKFKSEETIKQIFDSEYWKPKSRNPENLYEFYKGNENKLTKDQINHAQADLSVFAIPSGLNKDQFKKWVGFYLIQMPLIREIDDFVDRSRRFGEITDFINLKLNLRDRGEDPQRFWQTMMRWLLFFFEEKYEYEQPRYSEIFKKR